MRVCLLLTALLFSLSLSAADWRQYGTSTGMRYLFDHSSLKRSAGAFEVLIRLRKDGGQDVATRVVVDCRASSYRALDTGVVQEENYLVQDSRPGPTQPVGNSVLSPLLQQWCIDWSEPAGADWRPLAQSSSITLYFDATPFSRTGELERGVAAEFSATVKAVGGGSESLQRIHVDCRTDSHQLQEGLHRQNGVVTRLSVGQVMPITPGTPVAHLKQRLCRQDVAARQAAEAVASPCAEIRSDMDELMRSLRPRLQQGTPLCAWTASGMRSVEALKYRAIAASCSNGEDFNALLTQLRTLDCE